MEQNIGKKLKNYRESKFPNLGLRKAADEVKINFVYLNRIENNLLMPSEDMIVKLAMAYGLTDEQEFEIFQLANKVHLHPKIKKHLENLEQAEQFFRKISK